ncbi:PAS domain S-box protein [Beggiatoa leptomitoformis]|uniref:histidine kinase n=1 Tax=Beggiatoa leptomitoformis TaxID=288004 RepID=A0A2N9YI36_9GAMM|nr:PAS domain S-box protein [Beggiatoa leptomitoformis]ALG67856.1 PAS domain S-box protein [Beggiatoa leptomitoformis]AUI69886.1 PAS domain S-box protein [Beggiatoa leptomitoformis]
MAVNNPRHSRFFWRSSAMFGILDMECQFKEVNAAWEKTLGLSTGQLLAKTFFAFVHQEDQPSTKYYFEQLEKGMASVSFACRFRHHDGTYRQILWEINGAASQEYAYHAVGMDITGREQPMIADEILSVLQEGVVLQYANGTIGACNPSAEQIIGLPAEQMMGWTLIDPDWRAIHEDGSPFPTETHPAICTLRTGQAYSDVVMGVVKSDESIFWLRVNSYPLWRDDVTTPYAVVISFSDISHYKENELTIRKEIQKRSSSPETVTDNNYELWDWNLDSNEVYFSSRWKKMLGFEEAELPNHIDTWHQRIHPSDYKKVMADIQNHLEGVTPVCENTHRLQHKDGSYRWILSRAVLVRDANGKPQRMVGTHIDVTETRRVEEELQETEKKYRQLLEVENNAVFMIDAESTGILELNKAAVQMYGYGRNDLLKMKTLDLSAQPEKTAKSIKKGLKYTSQQYHKKEDGTVFPVEVTANPFIWRGKQVLMLIVHDISERQKIETALWESESKYRQLFEASSNPTIVFDANTQQIFDVNHAAVDLYGFSKEDWLRLKTEEVSAESMKQRSAFGGGTTKKVQTIPLRWHRKKDGTVFPVEISTGNTYLFQGRSLICATVRDITERKAAEEALRKERDFINMLVQASPAFFFALEPDGKIRLMNKAMLNALGYVLDEVAGKEYLTFVPESERGIVATEFDTLRKSMQPSLLESHVISKSGVPLLVEWHSRAIVKANGALDYIFGVGIDVTERKKAQGHLRLFKSIIESSAEAIFVSNPEGQVVYVNPAHEKLLGYSTKDSRQMNYRTYYSDSSLMVWESDVVPALEEGGSWEGELEVHTQEGQLFPVWERVDAVRDTGGNILFSFGLLHDISEQQRTRDTLYKQAEENHVILNTIPAFIWYRDRENQLVRQNLLADTTFGTGNPLVMQLTDGKDVLRNGLAQFGIIQTYPTKTGDAVRLKIDKLPYHDGLGRVSGVIVYAIQLQDNMSLSANKPTDESVYEALQKLPFMLMAFDKERTLMVWNEMCTTITGYSGEEMVGDPAALKQLYPSIDQLEDILFSTSNQASFHWESLLTAKDGQLKNVVWYDLAKYFALPKWFTWYLGYEIPLDSYDDDALHDDDVMLSAVFDASKLGLCLTDDRGRFLRVNRTYAEFYGYRQDELLGQPFTLVLPSNTHSEAVREYYSLLMTNEQAIMYRQRNEQHRTGAIFETNVMASRVILNDKRRLLLSVVNKVI